MKPALTVITLGVSNMGASIRFYEALGFERRMKATGEEVAFFAAGGIVIGLWSWDLLAADAGLPGSPRPDVFWGSTLAWNCATSEDVDAAFAHALKVGGKSLVKPEKTFYGGYRGYFADPEGHVWEVVQTPGIEVMADGRVTLPD